MKAGLCVAVLLTRVALVSDVAVAAEPVFLRRSLTGISEHSVDLSTPTAHYRPIFGLGDPNSQVVKGIERFGELTVEPGGSSKIVSYKDEEQVYFILEGAGVLRYGQERTPVKQNDFLYLPVGIEHGIDNPQATPLHLIVMGFRIPVGTEVPPTPRLMLANADDVQPQVLGQHGPTTQFRLLMSTTQSKRDKLAAAQRVNSLFLMDFAPGGTNIPHRHNKEEEVYYVLRGRGDMIAGTDKEGKEMRHPSAQGDAFFFSVGAMIGFYSGTEEGQEHARILAVRSAYPSPSDDTSRDEGKR